MALCGLHAGDASSISSDCYKTIVFLTDASVSIGYTPETDVLGLISRRNAGVNARVFSYSINSP